MTISEQADAIRKSMDNIATALTDDQAMGNVYLFMPWSDSAHYTADERVRYAEQLYKCLTEHDAQETRTPNASQVFG